MEASNWGLIIQFCCASQLREVSLATCETKTKRREEADEATSRARSSPTSWFTYLAIVVLTWVRITSMYWSIWVWKETREKVSISVGREINSTQSENHLEMLSNEWHLRAPRASPSKMKGKRGMSLFCPELRREHLYSVFFGRRVKTFWQIRDAVTVSFWIVQGEQGQSMETLDQATRRIHGPRPHADPSEPALF